jgi:LPXTG-site transpeptidase (sortase) family protein
MIAAGLLICFFSITQVIRDLRVYHSPLDQVSQTASGDRGFLPMLSARKRPIRAAPTLGPGAEASQQPATASGSNDLEGRESPGTEALQSGNAEEDMLKGNHGQPFDPYGPSGGKPLSIEIPAIDLQSPIIPVDSEEIETRDGIFEQWSAPNMHAVGWHRDSALPGVIGNTVLNGHHNMEGEVFRDLDQLEAGDLIFLHTEDRVYTYQVGLTMILKERFQPVEVRLANAQWIQPSQDERITLISCWPYESNTHRVVVVAVPDRTQSKGISQ